MADWHRRPRHSDGDCAEFLASLLPDLPGDAAELHLSGGLEPEATSELLGRALWEIFSDNHTVVDDSGSAYDLGSFRASGDFIARILNERYRWLKRPFTYLDFYMGGMVLRGRSDLAPLHRWVFSRLRAAGCDWIYSFPRLNLVDLGGAVANAEDAFGVDPSEAVRRELEERRREEEIQELSSRLDDAYDEAVRRARHEPLPSTVAAYRTVFGVLPEGWPHSDM